MFLEDREELKDDISADDRRFEAPEAPIALEAGPRREGLEASGVLFLLPIILLAIAVAYSCIASALSEISSWSPAELRLRSSLVTNTVRCRSKMQQDIGV